jgi:hypothetical protein
MTTDAQFYRESAALHEAQRIYDNVTDDPSYQELVAELAKECTCTPVGNRPCDGLLAGGLCDDLHMDGRKDDLDDQEDTRNEDEPDNL